MDRHIPTSSPYKGTENNLIVSIDLGTTFSGTSWVLLEPGEIPNIWDVSAIGGGDSHQGTKVPTVLFYDSRGNLRAAGAETLYDRTIDEAVDQKWKRVEWFKLLLRPGSLAHILDRAPKTKLPWKKRLVDVIADFLRYMAKLAHKHFREAIDSYGEIWNLVKDRVIYILSHPNGWNLVQHPIMREAAILAELIPNSEEAKNRIIFVSEGEASLHWCMSRGIGRKDLKVDNHFIVVDAGGGTIDISSFKTIGTMPLEFEESSVPECYLEGSAFVTQAFREYVQAKLEGSSFGHPSMIQRMVEHFDQHAKRDFKDPDEDMPVRFGREGDNDPNVGIKDGRIVVSGKKMASFYENACNAIVTSVKSKVPGSKTIVVLVGGFAGNTYLFNQVKSRLEGPYIQVLRPNEATTKASASGMLCFYLDRSVRARMAKWTYGVSCVHDFNPKDPKHVERQHRVKIDPVTGRQFIDGGFLVTLKKGTVVQETEFTRFPFWHSQKARAPITLDLALACYRGDVPDIKFRDEDSDQIQELCWFKAEVPETSLVRRKANVKSKESGKYYYVSNFHVVVSFGATEFKCYIDWKDEKGTTGRGSIAPIWGDVFHAESRLSPSMTSPGAVSKKNLIISLDLGTTFSAASWVLLGNSQDPYIWDVSEREELPAKVPTVLYYDDEGYLRAAGCETLDKGIIIDAEEQGWTRVEWFKLLLHADSLAHQLNNAPKSEMPRKKKLVHIIADLFRYMASLASNHFHETMDNEGQVWKEVKDRVIYILSHPNGWNTFQHAILREAAILAGLVPDSDEGSGRIILVSEAEASLHWCVERRLAMRDLKAGSNYIIVDAGGGAINISSFRTVGTTPLEFEESSIPECHLRGSVFVTQAFRGFIQDKLKGSCFGNPDAMERMVKDFDQQVKYGFRDRDSDTFVTFGKSHDNDSRFDIDGGQLLVRGEEMARLFEPACSAIVRSVKAIVVPSAKTAVVLVGGFAGNRYLFSEVQRRLPGIVVIRANDAKAKAAAHGAIRFHLERIVIARMAKWTYGVRCIHNFDPKDPKHVQRRPLLQTNPVTGQQFIEGGFFVTLKRGTAVREADLTRFPFWHSQPERTPTTLDICLEYYQGDVLDIKFRDEDREELFRELCWFKAAISETALVRRVRNGQRKNKEPRNSAKHYYVCNFHIVFSFGGPEYKFYIEWRDERGMIHKGPITPISKSVHDVKIGSE